MQQALVERSKQQRLDALERANGVRFYRAARKKDVASGKLPPDWFIASFQRHNPDMATMRLLDALQTIPGIGERRANKLVQQAGLSPKRMLGGLTRAQMWRLQRAVMESPALRRRHEEWVARG